MIDTLPRTNDGKFVKGFIYSPETMFTKGQIPVNKGQKFPGTGNCKSFSKGHLPHNTLHDLATSIRSNNQGRKYVFVRISQGKWDFLQRYRWSNEVGPIPKNMMLRCKTEDTTNCCPSNWELVSKGENARRNRFECSEKPRICQTCNKEFLTKSRQSKFCSEDCRKAGNLQYMHGWHAKNAKPKKEKKGPKFLTENVKECVVCKSKYKPNSNRQVTCSDACKATHNHQRITKYRVENKPVREQKHCSKCGQLFAPKNNRSTSCQLCREAKPRQIKCLNCGTEFTSKGRGVQLLCSDQCKRERKNKLRADFGLKNRTPKQKVIISCLICGNEFERCKGSKYCSDACKKEVKTQESRNRRQLIREGKLPKPVIRNKPAVLANCCVCGTEYQRYHKIRYCSDACRLEMKRQKGTEYYQANHKRPKAQTPTDLTEPRRAPKLNKRNPKAEKEAAYAMLELNRNAPKHDREIITRENIVSPDLSNFEFKVYDKQLRITRFFRSEERYHNFLKEKQDERN